MKTFKFILLTICLSVATICSSDYSEKPQVADFIDLMVNKHNFEREQVLEWLSAAKHQTSIVKAMSRPAEKVKPWHEYRNIFVTELRIKRGVEFWQQHEEALNRAYKEYGVDPAIIVSILGVETNYGRNTGSYRVIDALSTLAFDYYHNIEKRESRKNFFTIQLENLLLLAREQKKDPLSLKGSYAGAMGWGQFMPDSYRDYAVDFDGDNLADIWTNPTDAIGSVANYFNKKGDWLKDQPVATRAHIGEKLDTQGLNKMRKPTVTITELIGRGYQPVQNFAENSPAFPMKLTAKYADEYWLGFHNFYAIGRYNPRIKYAMAVYQLSLMIRDQRCEISENCG
jgi:membrane-bound lytic murein transglycosylase B